MPSPRDQGPRGDKRAKPSEPGKERAPKRGAERGAERGGERGSAKPRGPRTPQSPRAPETVSAPNPEPKPRAGATVRASRVLDAPASAVFRALNDPARRGWSPEPLYRVLSALAPRFVRLALPDGSQVSVAITRQGNVRCSVAIEHTGLPADSQPIAMRQRWMAALAALAEQLDTDLD